MKRVYIAGALNAMAVDYIQNLHRMIHYARLVRNEGYAVFVPGLDFLMGLQYGNWTYRDYFDNSIAWLEISDAVYVVPGSNNSAGVKCEIKRAAELKIPVATSIADLNYIFNGDHEPS